ncbi:hypothetical protein HK102_002163 [Quaeritorhiza haematococci]|nr:hypothetical protein HK102_002163 [Quaeritorhiza haematococci]
MPRRSHRLAVIGAGNVGATIAYAAVIQRIASEVLLVDIDQRRCEAQVLNISDAAYTSDTKVRVGTYKDAGQCDVIVITAGARQRPNETRVELIDRNYNILKSCNDEIQPINKEAVLMLVANPSTSLAPALSSTRPVSSPPSPRSYVAETSLHFYTLGEHGDSQFIAWSTAHIANNPLLEHPKLINLDKKKMEADVRNKTYKIIEVNGATSTVQFTHQRSTLLLLSSIGACAASLCETIFGDRKHVRPVSHYIEELGVCLSLPAVVGAQGVQQTLKPNLSKEEEAALQNSAAALKKIISKYDQ